MKINQSRWCDDVNSKKERESERAKENAEQLSFVQANKGKKRNKRQERNFHPKFHIAIKRTLKR